MRAWGAGRWRRGGDKAKSRAELETAWGRRLTGETEGGWSIGAYACRVGGGWGWAARPDKSREEERRVPGVCRAHRPLPSALAAQRSLRFPDYCYLSLSPRELCAPAFLLPSLVKALLRSFPKCALAAWGSYNEMPQNETTTCCLGASKCLHLCQHPEKNSVGAEHQGGIRPPLGIQADGVANVVPHVLPALSSDSVCH